MKILSLNGGGTLGYITLCVLEHLEEEAGKPCYEIFDLISGVSTGSIIGFALSSGFTAKETKDLYRNLIPEIFKNKTGFIMSFFKPYYKIETLERILKENIGNKMLSEAKTNFMCHATKINSPEIRSKFWKSWKKEHDVEAWKALTASCAAPLYFSPYQVGEDLLIDGGLVSNSPNVVSIVEALKLGSSLEDIKMLNLTVNNLTTYESKKDLIGLLTVANNVPLIAIWGTEKIEMHQAENLLLKNNFSVVYPNTNLGIDNKEFDAMQNIADELWFNRKLAFTWILE